MRNFWLFSLIYFPAIQRKNQSESVQLLFAGLAVTSNLLCSLYIVFFLKIYFVIKLKSLSDFSSENITLGIEIVKNENVLSENEKSNSIESSNTTLIPTNSSIPVSILKARAVPPISVSYILYVLKVVKRIHHIFLNLLYLAKNEKDTGYSKKI